MNSVPDPIVPGPGERDFSNIHMGPMAAVPATGTVESMVGSEGFHGVEKVGDLCR